MSQKIALLGALGSFAIALMSYAPHASALPSGVSGIQSGSDSLITQVGRRGGGVRGGRGSFRGSFSRGPRFSGGQRFSGQRFSRGFSGRNFDGVRRFGGGNWRRGNWSKHAHYGRRHHRRNFYYGGLGYSAYGFYPGYASYYLDDYDDHDGCYWSRTYRRWHCPNLYDY